VSVTQAGVQGGALWLGKVKKSASIKTRSPTLSEAGFLYSCRFF